MLNQLDKYFFNKLPIEDLNLLIEKRDIIIHSDKLINLTGLKTYTIDDPSTIEIDDAISLEVKGLKRYLWIHISSPAEYIYYRSTYEKLARKKATSFYLDNLIETMLPLNLIEELLTLSDKRKNITLSTRVLLDKQGNISEYLITRAIVKPTYRLNYEEALELIELRPKEEEELVIFYEEMYKRQNYRLSKGAINIEEPYGKLYKDGSDIKHSIIYQTYSKFMIKEAMLLYGTVLADYCNINNIHVPYRNQKNIIRNNKRTNITISNQHVSNFLLKRNISPPSLEIEAKGHSSIGVDSYVQATSPIRRYIDLLTHIQLLNYIKGEAIIPRDELKEVIIEFELAYKQANERIKNNNLANISKWFSYNNHNLWESIFLCWLNKTRNIALVYFPQMEMDIACLIPSNKYYVGKHIKLIFSKIDNETSLVNFVETSN